MKSVAKMAVGLSIAPAVAAQIANEKSPEYRVTERELARIMKTMKVKDGDEFTLWTGREGVKEFEKAMQDVLGEEIKRLGKA